MNRARTTRFAAFVSAVAAVTTLAAVTALAQPQRGGGGFGIDARAQERSYRFTDTDEDLQYCLFKSSKVDAATPAPLIVSLHGLGAGPQVMCNSTAIELAEQGGYILVAPIGYNTSGWYGVPSEYQRAVGRGGGGRGGRGGAAGGAGAASAPANVGELSEKDVLNVLDLVRKEFNVDPKRIYLTGHSMGAAGTVYLGSKHADVWAAIAPVAGGVRLDKPEILDPLKAAGIPLLLVIGDADEVVAIDEARAFKTKLEAAGIEHEYVELPGISHGPVITASQEHVYAFFATHMK
jgi:poly(3-hydroxybutyrate) depolymerase